ncbi:MAG: CHAT domain-containing protein, partial [Anaerolineales bacterium]
MKIQPSAELVDKFFSLQDFEGQLAFLDDYFALINDDEVARRLKDKADQLLRSDIQGSLRTSQLILHLADLTRKLEQRALGLLAEANARAIGLGEYEESIELYDLAKSIYAEHGYRVEEASSLIGKIGALTFLGRYREALQVGEWAAGVLEATAEWFRLAKIVGNMGIIYYRLGKDNEALASFERAQQLYEKAGEFDGPGWLRAEFNRAIVLRNLGQFEDSIRSSRMAYQKLSVLSQPVEAARALQNLAMTYFVLGRYNESLEILDQVREIFVADDRQRDAILAELFISDCLLQLGRFQDVLDKSKHVRSIFKQLGTRFEVGLAILNEAVAYSGLKRFDEALDSLKEAKQLFEEQGQSTWAAYSNLEVAAVYLRKGHFEESLQTAMTCIQLFESQPLKRAQANLIAARALLALDRTDAAEALTEESRKVGEEINAPILTFNAHSVLGKLAEARSQFDQALVEYDRAIRDLEGLRGRMMIEFRPDFLEDKQSLYEDIVSLCIDLDRPMDALQYAERAKSRALLELISHRVDLRVSTLDPADQHLANELIRLRTERDRLYRRWESTPKEELRVRGGESFDQEVQQARIEILSIENRITEIWHKLLIRNAGYARDASLWQIRVEPIQPYLDSGMLLLEYYFARDQLYLFLITHNDVLVQRLPGNLSQIQPLLQLLWLNWRTVPRSAPNRIKFLTQNATGILEKLHNLLIAPGREVISSYRKLIIVPHGPLHYLPFHALFDGQEYLIANHEISYLPAASFLRYCLEVQPTGNSLLVAGNSFGGRLPFTVPEAHTVAHMWDTNPIIEDEVTLKQIQEKGPGSRALHLAAHGSFRPDNPLFSGLALADGWLTTLDIFNLRLQASLVTLSACETGRSVVSGGDELLGLMRAFLYAGAASLVLSQWAVYDRS